jgi:hypothetical protein
MREIGTSITVSMAEAAPRAAQKKSMERISDRVSRSGRNPQSEGSQIAVVDHSGQACRPFPLPSIAVVEAVARSAAE